MYRYEETANELRAIVTGIDEGDINIYELGFEKVMSLGRLRTWAILFLEDAGDNICNATAKKAKEEYMKTSISSMNNND